jgi:N-glycosylase/DNA lyase
MGVDRSGRVKMDTLEVVYLVQSYKGWCTTEDAYRELASFVASPFASGRRGVSMRLLRYKRQGLLIRIKIDGRLTEYKLSKKGEDRLIYFWKKFNLLSPPPGWQFMGEEGINGRKLSYQRFLLYKEILSNQIKRLKMNRPLRTPRVRRVIRFQSTLDKIDEKIKEEKKRLRAFLVDI